MKNKRCEIRRKVEGFQDAHEEQYRFVPDSQGSSAEMQASEDARNGFL